MPKRPAGGDALDGDVVGYYDRSGKAVALEEEEDAKRNAELKEDLADARDGDPVRTAQLGANQQLSSAADRLSQAAERMSEGSHRRQMYEGTFTASGPASVGTVVGDLVSLLAQQRVDAGKTAILKGGESLSSFAVAGGLAQALNLTPIGDKPVVGQDLARYQLYAEQALRLGLDGDLTQAVATQIGERGDLQPATRDTLRSQVQTNTGWSDERVKAEIRTLENRAGMLPDEVRASGAMPVLVQLEAPQVSNLPIVSQPSYSPTASADTSAVQRSALPIVRPAQPRPATPTFTSVDDSIEVDTPQRSALPVLRPRSIARNEGQDA